MLGSTHSREMKTPGIGKHPNSGPSDLLGGVCDRPNPESLWGGGEPGGNTQQSF